MVTYGIRARHKSTHALPGPCSHCGTEGRVVLDIHQRYAHVFWIPVFPVGRRGETTCEHCQEVRRGKELHPADRQLYLELAKEDRTPVWMFSGVLVVGLLIPLAFWQSDRHDKAVRAMLQAPIPGDIYEIELASNRFTIYKVIDVQKDSVTVLLNNSEANKLQGIYTLVEKGDAGFGNDQVSYSLADLQRMRDEESIFSVRRAGE